VQPDPIAWVQPLKFFLSQTGQHQRIMAGDRLAVLVLGQAVPFWPRGWIKFQWAPTFLIVLRIALTGK
jgi:hypothetical protein